MLRWRCGAIAGCCAAILATWERNGTIARASLYGRRLGRFGLGDEYPPADCLVEMRLSTIEGVERPLLEFGLARFGCGTG